ncbi:MAG TPA: phage holin family protein [Geminicoccaceae bacterium]|nr:phage holin family protein [Geminicoccaceae bacterium]
MMLEPTEGSSLKELFTRLTSEVTELFRKEVQLIRAESSERVSQAVAAIIMIMAGGFMGLAALILLLEALAMALSAYTNLSLISSGLIVAVVVAAIGGFLAWKGTNDLRAGNLLPKKSIRSLKRDAEMAKEHVT